MTLISNTTEVNSALGTQAQLNWKNCWYPIIFVRDFPGQRPYEFTLYDEPLVLFQDKAGNLACLRNICPHRAAKLSDGQIIDGKIECLYHGWQFDLEGKCQHIPQLSEETTIPGNACVKSFIVVEKQGIIWFWRGEKKLANEDLIPTLPKLESKDFAASDFAIDLPYDQSYLIENIIDPAHVHISHDGSLGDRKKAQPLIMEILESSIKGIQSRYKYSQQNNSEWIELDFIAPNLVKYGFTLGRNKTVGTALYSIPTAKGSCRLLLRNYSNFWLLNKLKPLWLSHLENNRILEEDSVFIVAEQNQIEKSGKSIKETFLPLKTSDVFVVEYRKWLDNYGKNLPFFQGYINSKLVTKAIDNWQEKVTIDRLKQHTQICSTCSKAHQLAIRSRQVLIGIAIALAALAIVSDQYPTQIIIVICSLLSVILAVVAEKIKTKFERAYSRH